jgi:hypothetical protein
VAPPIAASVEALKAQLAAAPFNMRILETNAPVQAVAASAAPAATPAARVPLSDWLNKVTTAVAVKVGLEQRNALRREGADHFVIEGVLR